MQESEKINDYLELVRQQIRWKKAHLSVIEEIRNHIIDQRDAYIYDGHDEDTATEMAIAEMGDPVIVGEQLDRTHRSRPDWPMLIMTLFLLLLGLSIQFLVGQDISNGKELFTNQVVWTAIAILVLLTAYYLDFTIIGKYPKIIFFGLSFLAIGSFLFTQGNALYSIYPVLLFPTAFAGFIYSMRSKGYAGIILCGASLFAPACISRLVPSLTFYFLLCISCLIVLTAAIIKGWFGVNKLYALSIIYIPTFFVWTIPYFANFELNGDKRLQIVLNPLFEFTGSDEFIKSIVKQMLANSQFLGRGLPIDAPVSGYGNYTELPILPEAHTDFLLTYLIYRFGWIVLIVLLAIFVIFFKRALNICMRQHSVLGFLSCLAITLTITIECILYFSWNFGFMVFTPLSLPLLSYGGRALIVNTFLIGLLLSVNRTGNLFKDNASIAGRRIIGK